MDAPPPQEDVRPFVHVAGLIAAAGLHAPRVLEADAEHGFLLLDDLGSELYLAGAAGGAGERRPAPRRPPDARRDRRPRHLAAQGAGDRAAAVRRRAAAPRARALSRLVRRRANAASTWSAAEAATWNEALRPARRRRAGAAGRRRPPRLDAEEPDGRRSRTRASSTSRTPSPGRSATTSPRCCATPSSRGTRSRSSTGRSATGRRRARRACRCRPTSATFWRSVEWIGLQRHLKVLGIFSRLKHRDGKPAYSADLPRFFAYAHKVATRYSTPASARAACSSR